MTPWWPSHEVHRAHTPWAHTPWAHAAWPHEAWHVTHGRPMHHHAGPRWHVPWEAHGRRCERLWLAWSHALHSMQKVKVRM